MLASQRHQLIIDILDERHLVTVRELTDALNASEPTIRRDLLKLAGAGKLQRVRGGAQRVARVAPGFYRQHLEGSAFLASREQNAAQKRRIAERAVALCEDGESIIINGGSSTYMMAEFLRQRELNILTNSFPLAMELLEHSDNRITLPGGELYRKQNIVLSAFENDSIRHYHGTKMFMGTPGIGDYGVMESDPLLVRAEQKLMAQADRLIVLADSSKLGRRSNFILCPLDRVDTIVTDSGAEEQHLALFREQGVEVILVDAAGDTGAQA